MRELAGDADYNEQRKVLVLIDYTDRPEMPAWNEGTNLEKSREMHKWLDSTFSPVKDVIGKLGGVVLEQNWFWSGMSVELPRGETDLGKRAIMAAEHVIAVIDLV